MSKTIRLTKAQQKAVDLRGHTMLVSAAAGSGKTAVLTKRIIELVTDADNPVDVSELLVVTFTKAAATELKERISSAIYSALKQDPTNKHLSNQLLLLGKAKICTIHSFCSSLIKSNFQALGLPANMRIADETESGLICNNTMNEVIDGCYGGLYSDRISDFAEFTETFMVGKTDDGLASVFAELYNKLRNYPEGIALFKDSSRRLREGASDSPLKTIWGAVLIRELKRKLIHFSGLLENACEYFQQDEMFARSYLPAFEADFRCCSYILSRVESSSYTELKALFDNRESVKLGRVLSDNQTDKSVYFKSVRTSFNEFINGFSKAYLSFSEETVKNQLVATADICDDLYALLNIFDAKYEKEKKARGLLDYNDLERYSLRLLYNNAECSEISELAKSVREKYRYIFIDEYQDVNELQDKIFSGISTPTNRFMVGDIKQSIYGFRGSEPRLFSEYRKKFPEYSGDVCPDSDGVTLYLSNNFRSDRTVIDFSNAVFEGLFNNNSGSTPYTEGDRLVCSKTYGENEEDFKVRLCFMNEGNETEDAIDEAEFVAGEIEKLVRKGTDPSDIALLLRSRANAVCFEEALKKRNIESFNQVDRDFFENDAVLLMLCLLNAVDNPSRDIYLAGVMKSPLFGFTMTDITVIRRSKQGGSLYGALKYYTDLHKNEKCLYFMSKLKEWRKYAEGCPVDKLVRYIYNQTHIVELLSGKKNRDSDIERQANLLLLYEYARQFENGSFKGLYNFILYLNDVLEKRTSLSNARMTSEGKGVVNIMSIHNSKGLEFDTVFLCDTSHQFNRKAEMRDYILHKELGLTVKLRDSTSFGKINTMPRNAAKIVLREEALDEDLRVLYVALTRAKKRLIITSSLKNAKEKIEEISSEDTKVSQSVLLDSKNMIELILWGILKSDYDNYSLEYIDSVEDTLSTVKSVPQKVYDTDLIHEYKKTVDERLSYNYPYKELTELPSKLAVSKLHPGVLDEYTAEIETSAPSMYVKPKFLLPENQRATGAERGTATHVFMQFCDFENAEKNGVDKELSRLVEKGFIDKRNAELVNIEKAEAFFRSDIYMSLKGAKNIWRERRFNIKLPAASFTEDSETKQKLLDESVLVQGVIDLMYVDENDKVVLADYKTDWFSDKDINSGEAEKILIERHKTQLSYYAEACKKMFGKNVDEILIYSFALNKTVKIK